MAKSPQSDPSRKKTSNAEPIHAPVSAAPNPLANVGSLNEKPLAFSLATKKKVIPVPPKDFQKNPLSPSLVEKQTPLATQQQKKQNEVEVAKKYKFYLDSHYPEAKWNIGGAFSYSKTTLLFLRYCKNNIEGAIKPEAVHGAPPSLWSLEWYKNKPMMSPTEIIGMMEKYAQAGIGLMLDLDNPDITQELLADKIGNCLLDYLVKYDRIRKNSVVVGSSLLGTYIKQRYPKLPLHAGVNMAIAENARGNLDYYRKRLETYQTVALHPNDVLNPSFLAQLPEKERLEITVNDSCLSGCPVRRQHLSILGKIRQNPFTADYLAERHQLLQEAKCEEINVLWSATNRPLALLPSELEALYNMGFRRFRIQSETLRNEITFMWDIFHYITNYDLSASNKTGLLASSFISEFDEERPDLNSGLNDFSFGKYD